MQHHERRHKFAKYGNLLNEKFFEHMRIPRVDTPKVVPPSPPARGRMEVGELGRLPDGFASAVRADPAELTALLEQTRRILWI